jgi:hypothetical protein
MRAAEADPHYRNCAASPRVLFRPAVLVSLGIVDQIAKTTTKHEGRWAFQPTVMFGVTLFAFCRSNLTSDRPEDLRPAKREPG